MNWKKKSSKNGLLYVILDKEVIDEAGNDIFSMADKLAHYGADLLQLRAKNIADKKFLFLAKQLSKIIRRRKKLFIVNDRADIAYLAQASGLHLGEEDISAQEARKLLGKKVLIGRTIHYQEELKNIQTEIDYISLGPAFKTKTKPGLAPLTLKKTKALISKSKEKNKKLIFAIGGINLYNVESLLESGVKNVAVCRDILEAKNLKTAVKEYKKCLKKIS